ncbi:MAG: hypothetical protein HYU58_05575 [Proteobacteria bacterium]|nr:hypothetical protein [Pseudomonadota bacterium]
MLRISDLHDARLKHSLYDAELWSFVDQVQGRNLVNASDDRLLERLHDIDENILFLDDRTTARDDLKPEQGWLSPWWWWRMRHWTLTECGKRGLALVESTVLPVGEPLRPEFRGVFSGGRRLLVRISRRDRILKALMDGQLRFAPAASYKDSKMGVARTDEEMAKHYLRPGCAIAVAKLGEEPTTPIGDVAFASRRGAYDGRQFTDIPYWLCSFSSDLDPRLFFDFADRDGAESACLVIFQPGEFVRRILPKLNGIAPLATKSLVPTEYFDPYHPMDKTLSVVRHKHFSYACQREMRFVVDPEGNPWSACAMHEAFCVEAGSIEDIAAAYQATGERIAGNGPDNFLA